jgi:hypothetical protein
MIDTLHTWLLAATSDEQQQLADASTSGSTNTLFQYALGNRTPSAEKAGMIEQAAEPITRKSKGRLPQLLRTDMVAACRECPYARKCLGAKAAGGDFEPLREP